MEVVIQTPEALPAKRKRARLILKTLSKSIKIDSHDYISLWLAKKHRDPFRVLVGTILSQSSTDVNAFKAYRNLEKRKLLTPESLISTDRRILESCIKVAGLQRARSKALKQLSRDLFAKGLERILFLPPEDAREELMQLPGVGPKTADVLLVSLGKHHTIPVDTHVDRVSKRLGFASSNMSYEKTRGSLEQLYPPDDYHKVHLYLIALGRQYCTSRRPDCPACPVSQLCPYPKKTLKTDDVEADQ